MSDAFIAWLMPDDLFHTRATVIFNCLRVNNEHIFTTHAVIGEVMTVLGHRGGQRLASQFHSHIQDAHLSLVFVDHAMHDATIRLFLEQIGKGTSDVDCANAVMVQQRNVKQIFSFDGFYQRLSLSTLGA